MNGDRGHPQPIAGILDEDDIERDRMAARQRLSRRLDRAFQRQVVTGLWMAALARLGAIAVITIWLFTYLGEAAWFYVPAMAIFAGNPLLNYVLARGRFARNWYGYAFYALDVAVLTVVLLLPNPLLDSAWPVQLTFRSGNIVYFFVLLALAALSYSPGLMWWAGGISVLFWGGAVAWVAMQPETIVGMPGWAETEDGYEFFLNPHYLSLNLRIQEGLVLLVVAGILAISVRRTRDLVARQVVAARERGNLARYFPPNIVDRLADSDRPLGEVRTQQVAVLFADIVGFTHLVEDVTPVETVEMLRAFHRRMGAIIFRNNGSLTKFLGDGIMATFGTPDPDPHDAANAVACAREMIAELDNWNIRRVDSGFPPVPLSIGVHFGEVVLGDIGSERQLEFAVLGDTVNVASRLEEATRVLGCRIAVSGAAFQSISDCDDPRGPALMEGFERRERVELPGRAGPVTVWTYGAAGN